LIAISRQLIIFFAIAATPFRLPFSLFSSLFLRQPLSPLSPFHFRHFHAIFIASSFR
jgi:hypothetical protein